MGSILSQLPPSGEARAAAIAAGRFADFFAQTREQWVEKRDRQGC
jgi:hypothetical protein